MPPVRVSYEQEIDAIDKRKRACDKWIDYIVGDHGLEEYGLEGTTDEGIKIDKERDKITRMRVELRRRIGRDLEAARASEEKEYLEAALIRAGKGLK